MMIVAGATKQGKSTAIGVTVALNSGVYFLRDVFPIFDDKVKCFYLS